MLGDTRLPRTRATRISVPSSAPQCCRSASSSVTRMMVGAFALWSMGLPFAERRRIADPHPPENQHAFRAVVANQPSAMGAWLGFPGQASLAAVAKSCPEIWGLETA
jgi:hypothetical protein